MNRVLDLAVFICFVVRQTNLGTFRGENGELRVGVRRAMRQQGNVPSSVISSHSMHLGVLATAWHAILTGTMFTVYYKPRFVPCFLGQPHGHE